MIYIPSREPFKSKCTHVSSQTCTVRNSNADTSRSLHKRAHKRSTKSATTLTVNEPSLNRSPNSRKKQAPSSPAGSVETDTSNPYIITCMYIPTHAVAHSPCFPLDNVMSTATLRKKKKKSLTRKRAGSTFGDRVHGNMLEHAHTENTDTRAHAPLIRGYRHMTNAPMRAHTLHRLLAPVQVQIWQHWKS